MVNKDEYKSAHPGYAYMKDGHQCKLARVTRGCRRGKRRLFFLATFEILNDPNVVGRQLTKCCSVFLPPSLEGLAFSLIISLYVWLQLYT